MKYTCKSKEKAIETSKLIKLKREAFNNEKVKLAMW